MNNYFSNQFKRAIKRLLYYFISSNFLINYKIKKINKNQVIILNLHRVSNDINSSYTPLNIEIFEKMLKFLKKNFEIMTFSELKNSKKKIKPIVILSFDDGYEDFYKNVMPLTKKYSIKVNLNIIPNCIETNEPPINLLFQDFLYQAPDYITKKISIGQKTFLKKKDLGLFGNEISKYIKNLPYSDQTQVVDEIKKKYFNKYQFKKTKIMNIQQLKECALEHEIGIHSYYHSNMFYETDDFFINDTKNCINWSKKNLSIEPKIYAFPNNSYRNGQIEILKKMGFKFILLVNDKFSNIDDNIFNRFNFYADSYYEAQCKAVGFIL